MALSHSNSASLSKQPKEALDRPPGQRTVYYDCLRILGVFSVVMLHIAGENYYQVPIGSYDYYVLNFYGGLVRFCVPLLLMISGALFLAPKKNISLKVLYARNVCRIVAAYFVWTVFYGVVDYMRHGGIFFTLMVNKLLEGHYHLEFLPYLAGLYIMTPILRLVAQNRTILKYAICMCFIVAMLIPTIENFVGLPTLQGYLRKLHLSFPTQYIMYYLSGYYLSSQSFGKRAKFILIGLGVLGVICTVGISAAITVAQNEHFRLFGYHTVNVMCVAFGIFVFFKEYIPKLSLNDKWVRHIQTLSVCSFGVYLIHDLTIQFFRGLGLSNLSFNPLLSVPVISLLVFITSFILVYLVRKIPNKWLRQII